MEGKNIIIRDNSDSIKLLDHFISKYSNNKLRNNIAISLFDLPIDILKYLCNFHSHSQSNSNTTETINNLPSGLTCRVCTLVFNELEEQRTHFKSDLHINNVKRLYHINDKILYDNSIEELDSNTDNHGNDSDSSDSDIDEDITSSSNYILSNGKVNYTYDHTIGSQWLITNNEFKYSFSISSSILPKETILNDIERDKDGQLFYQSLYYSLSTINDSFTCAIFLYRSGKFSGAIFEGKNPIAHKVFRRYTIRAKSGGSQASHDNKYGKANSVGAQMRRKGENDMKNDIIDLIINWKDYLTNCSKIFISISKTKRSYLFNDIDKTFPLKKSDHRIVYLPLTIKNLTYEEVCSIHKICTNIYFYSTEQKIDSKQSDSNVDSLAVSQADSQVDSRSNEKSIELNMKSLTIENEKILSSEKCQISNQIINLCKDNNMQQLDILINQLIQSNQQLDVNIYLIKCIDILDPLDQNTVITISLSDLLSIPETIEDWMTPLHISTSLGYLDLVKYLLEHGANPCKRDSRNRTPFYLSTNKEMKDVYRYFRGTCEENSGKLLDENDKNLTFNWDWTKTGIDLSLTNDIINEKNKKLKEKQKEKEKRKKLKIKNEKIINEQEENDNKILELENERNLKEKLDKIGYCNECKVSLVDKSIVFLVTYKFCSMNCMIKRKRQIAAEAAEKRFGPK